MLRAAVAVFGAAPLPYHILNFILFNFICRLIYRLVKDLSGKPEVALMTAAIYAVHPAQHPLVANCFTLCLNIYILCGTGCLVAYLAYLDKRHPRERWLSAGLFLPAVLSHPAAWLIPVYLLIIARYRVKVGPRHLIGDLWPFGLILAAALSMRFVIPGTRGLLSLLDLNISVVNYLAVVWDLLCWYQAQLILPWRMIFLWDSPLEPAHALLKAFNLLMAAAGIGYLICARWRGKEEAMWLALYVAGFLPLTAAAFIYSPQTGTAIIEPLWFSLSSIGIYALAAGGLLRDKGRIPAKSFNGLVVGLCVALILMTLGHNAHWRDERSLCRYWLSVNPLNEVPWKRWALTYLRDGRESDLIKEIGELTPVLQRQNHPAAWTHRGQIYHRMGLYKEAMADYSQALKRNPDYIEALLSRSNAYALTEQWERAGEDLKRVLTLQPDHREAREDWQRIQDYLGSIQTF